MKRISFLILMFFSSVSITNASTYFEDNFTNIDTEKWSIYYNGGSVEVEGYQTLKISSLPSVRYPYFHTRDGAFPLGSYKTKIRFKLSGPLNYGAGIVFSDKLITNSTTNNLSASDVVFQVWPESQSQYSLWTTLCEINTTNCSLSTYKKITSFPGDLYQDLTIEYNESDYSVKLNDLETKKYVATRKLSYLWIGNPQQTTTHTTRPSIFVDYFIVETPEESKSPIVVLPGFGGSWDVDAVLTNSPGNNWKIPDFIKEYDGIINSLKNAGYKENEDLFIFAYDWRKPLDSLADDLNSFLISKNISGENTSFVGHSMGGLVARSYLQKYNSQNVGKIITVGSPHKGILDAYAMWEGLTVWDSVWWQKVLHLLATEVNRKSGETELQAARRVAPSVKDLLPTWNFLQKDEVLIPISEMVWKNDYLLSKNSQLTEHKEKIVSGFSSDHQSKDKLLISKPSKADIMKGLWQDGKPVKTNPFMFSAGDGYVTNSSSGDLFDNKLFLSGNHGEVISKKENLASILDELDIDSAAAVGSNFESSKKVAIFKLNSPGKLDVCRGIVCNENLGIVFSQEKLIMIPEYTEGNFDIRVKADGETGHYKLLIGEIEETADWNNSKGVLIHTDQVDNYTYNTFTNQIAMDMDTSNRNISMYFPQGVDLKTVNRTRQEILKQIDISIGTDDSHSFDFLLEKWLAINNYVASISPLKISGINHKDWGEQRNGFVRSRFISMLPNYFTERLAAIYTDLEMSVEEHGYGDNFYKLDKKAQMLMLRAFLKL